jgi:hypothetical protein
MLAVRSLIFMGELGLDPLTLLISSPKTIREGWLDYLDSGRTEET